MKRVMLTELPAQVKIARVRIDRKACDMCGSSARGVLIIGSDDRESIPMCSIINVCNECRSKAQDLWCEHIKGLLQI